MNDIHHYEFFLTEWTKGKILVETVTLHVIVFFHTAFIGKTIYYLLHIKNRLAHPWTVELYVIKMY